VITWLSSQTAADIVITSTQGVWNMSTILDSALATLINVLSKSRTGFKKTDTLINKLMRGAIQTGKEAWHIYIPWLFWPLMQGSLLQRLLWQIFFHSCSIETRTRVRIHICLYSAVISFLSSCMQCLHILLEGFTRT
jgi:Na+/proline symporter